MEKFPLKGLDKNDDFNMSKKGRELRCCNK